VVQNLDFDSKKIPVINGLRGIAASMVAFCHFASLNGYIESASIKSIFALGNTGVYIFFVISGVVIPLSMIRGGYGYHNWGTFMLKRLIRLEPPYLACIALALIYFQVRMLVPTSVEADLMPGPKDLMLHLGYLVPFFKARWALGIFWTLAVEFQYYLIISLLLPLALSGNKAGRYSFYLFFLCCPFFLSNKFFFPLHGAIFLMGIVYTFLLTNIIESRECFILTLLCIAVSLVVLPIKHTIAGVATLLIINFLPNLTNGVLEFLGKISYSLYLIHQVTGKALINVLSYKFRADYQKPIVIIAGYLFAIIAAYVFYRIIEKPSQKLSARIKYKQFRLSIPL